MALALLSDYQITIEEAFTYLSRGELPKMASRRLNLQPADISDMKALRAEKVKYREIGEYYGIHKSQVHRYIRGNARVTG